jgi:phosphocarrier protein
VSDAAQVSETFEIINELGLHARAATRLVKLAERFEAEIELEKDGQRANAKSIMGVLLLCGQRGSKITIIATGSDAAEAVEQMGALIRDRFGEER